MSYYKIEVSYFRNGRINYVSSSACKFDDIHLCVENLIRMFGINSEESPKFRVYAFIEEGEVKI